jgi:hypothetical protein
MGRMVTKRALEDRREDRQARAGDEGHERADVDQQAQRDGGGDEAADELDEAGADQVPHALDVAQDARDEAAGLGRVVVRDGQPATWAWSFSAARR